MIADKLIYNKKKLYMKTTFIYTLSDPDSLKIRYVGKSNNPKKRLYDHLKSYHLTTTHKNNWIKSIVENNKIPILNIIDEVPVDNWQFWEIYWISKLKNEGNNLTNISGGGNGSTYHKYNDRNASIEKMKIRHKEFPNYNKCYDKTYFLDKELLYQKYITENLSIPKLSEFFNVSEKTIFNNLKEHEINKDKSIWILQCASSPKKVVLQYDLDGNLIREWIGIEEIEKSGISGDNIAGCCRGLYRFSVGYIWRYKDEFIPIKPLRRKSYNNEVIQYDLNMNEIGRYESVNSASKIMGVSRRKINRMLEKKLDSDEFIWKFKCC